MSPLPPPDLCTDATPILYIRLFGPLTIQVEPDGDSLTASLSAKSRSLLAYLIRHHDRAIPRDRLTGLLWPERPDPRARRALSNSLWQTRRALGPAAARLDAERDSIRFRLRPQDFFDVEEFEARASRHDSLDDLDAAVSLYRSDFLDECYDDWALLERERLRELYLSTLDHLMTIHKRTGDYQQALRYAQRLVAADPLRESAHRELMRLYHLLGRTQAALGQYAAIRDLLAEELQLAPTPVTTALYREILAAQSETTTPYLPVAHPPPILLGDLVHLPLVGRSDERATLIATLQAAARGYGSVVLIAGEPGIGKSRLADETQAAAHWHGFQVGIGKAGPSTVTSSYQLLRDALTPLLTGLRVAQLLSLLDRSWLELTTVILPALAPHLPEPISLPTLDGDLIRRRTLEGLTRCLNGLASIAPLLIILEDLHWADEATLDALRHIAPRLTTSRLMMLVTYRTDEARQRPTVWETIENLDRSLPVVRLNLSPLTPADTATLIHRGLSVGEDDAQALAFARRLHRAAGGNALYLVEMLTYLLEHNLLAQIGPGEWLYPSPSRPLPTPASVQELINERLAGLPQPVRTVLEIVAVLGDDADYTVISEIWPAGTAALLAALGEAERRGFLVPLAAEARYRFEHDLMWDAVYNSIPPTRRQTLHRRAGEVLEQLHPERIESLAHHFADGGDRARGLRYTIRAGERAERACDYHTALFHYRRAEKLTLDIATRREVLARQEQVLYSLGRWAENAEVHEEMLDLVALSDDPAWLALTLHRIGRQANSTDNPDRAMEVLTEALTLARTHADRHLVGTLLFEIGFTYWRMGDVARCQEMAEQSRTHFRETGDLDGEAQVLGLLIGLHVGLTGDYSRALAYEQEKIRLDELRHDLHSLVATRGNMALTQALLGDYRAARQSIGPAMKSIRAIGDIHIQGAFLLFQAVIHLGLGETEEAERFALRALSACRRAGSQNFEIESLGWLGRIAIARGDWEQARRYLEQAGDLAATYGQKRDRAVYLSHLALTLALLGELTSARRLSTESLTVLERDPDVSDSLKLAYFERAQVETLARQPKTARRFLEKAYRALQIVAGRIGDPRMRRSFLENVAENRAIMTAYESGHIPLPARRTVVRLPRADAPTGRPLRDDELVTVTWTPLAPDDGLTEGKVARRRRSVLRLLREAGEQGAAPTITALAAALAVSERTVKRDLAALRAAGHDVRTRGSN